MEEEAARAGRQDKELDQGRAVTREAVEQTEVSRQMSEIRKTRDRTNSRKGAKALMGKRNGKDSNCYFLIWRLCAFA